MKVRLLRRISAQVLAQAARRIAMHCAGQVRLQQSDTEKVQHQMRSYTAMLRASEIAGTSKMFHVEH